MMFDGMSQKRERQVHTSRWLSSEFSVIRLGSGFVVGSISCRLRADTAATVSVPWCSHLAAVLIGGGGGGLRLSYNSCAGFIKGEVDPE